MRQPIRNKVQLTRQLLVSTSNAKSGQNPLPSILKLVFISCTLYRGADKSLARPTSRCILFDGENISFDASLVMGERGGVVVKALRYKPAGRGFDSRWCHWNFSVT